jgi:PII-like signaling protein
MRDGLELTVHMGERDRCSGGLLADVVMDLFERHGVRRSVMLRGAEGFGLRHALHSDRLLSVSEDLPIVAVAVDVPRLIETVLGEVRELVRRGLITLERVALMDAGSALAETKSPVGAARLTVWVARRDRAADGRAAHVAVLDCMHRHGFHSASVLLGLDGTAGGQRRRARLLDRNRHVPLPILAIGERHTIDAAIP